MGKLLAAKVFLGSTGNRPPRRATGGSWPWGAGTREPCRPGSPTLARPATHWGTSSAAPSHSSAYCSDPPLPLPHAATAAAAMGLFDVLYRVVMRRNAVYVTFVVAGAFAGERAVDYGVHKL
ncbi:hypothetical protein PVAP13_1KG450115 [Panicum virgatum]|uniref:Uncharacterized protein n=1 Tax=Panicum virgatum TaxID=38727 RepID=A0A8T0XKW0_PANVG|nr:hypothetical protein PVAP13_1KG450105 [Panicum virgatum]KAG2660562.1 hypothetical protein PVAP13_1KG450115 [Panicum virgatum]